MNKANELYRKTCELITLCQTHNLLWSCQKTGRSFMWQSTSFQRLFSTMKCESIQLHNCMYGSSRRKLTRLVHNIPSFHQLHQMCDNQHEHEPWGQKPDGTWATSEETAYPWPLVRAIAAQVVLQLQDQGLVCHLPSLAHSRLLSTPKRGYVASAKENNDNQVTVGVHFAPEEFLSEAVRLCHPTEHNCLFPKEVRANATHLSDRSVHQIALERTEEVKRWVALPKERNYPTRSEILSPQLAPE